jgi:hypothetical protein
MDIEISNQFVGTVGKQHCAPAKYKYCLKSLITDEFMLLLRYENTSFIGNLSNPDGLPYILNGLNYIDNIDVWVINQEKQGYYYLWFESKEVCLTLYSNMIEKKRLRERKVVNPIYKMTRNGWQQVDSYTDRNPVDLIGYESHLNTVQADMSNYNKYIDFLKSIGEGNRTLNYLLYGPPGTGKTTLIKTLGTLHNLPIYIVNPAVMENISASTVLNPKHSNHKNRIVLFEDFDRYLAEGRFCMSDILNQLDGVESTEGCIRFFTCNNVNEIYKHDALINRLSAKFMFDYPSINQFEKKLDRFLTFWDNNDQTNLNHTKKKQFLELVNSYNSKSTQKLTLRPYSNYIIRYLFDKDCLDKMIQNIDLLFAA